MGLPTSDFMCFLVITETGFFKGNTVLRIGASILFAVVRYVEVCGPCKVFLLYIDGSNAEIKTDVAGLSDIPHHGFCVRKKVGTREFSSRLELLLR